MPFRLDSPCDATLMPLRACAMDWRLNRILRVGKISGAIFWRLCTKVHEILRQYRGPLVLSDAVAQLSIPRFVQKIIAIKSRSRRKTEQM